VPPRVRFSEDQILDAALALTRAQGIDMVSARSLAAALGCSTGPLFTQFSSMDALHEQLVGRAMDHFVAATGEPQHDDPLRSVGLGWLRFATAEPRLYEAIFLRPHRWHAGWGAIRRRLADRMAESPRYAHLSRPARFALVGRFSIPMHGLGLELWSGRLPNTDLERLVDEIAMPTVRAALDAQWSDDFHSQSQSSTEGHST